MNDGDREIIVHILGLNILERETYMFRERNIHFFKREFKEEKILE